MTNADAAGVTLSTGDTVRLVVEGPDGADLTFVVTGVEQRPGWATILRGRWVPVVAGVLPPGRP